MRVEDKIVFSTIKTKGKKMNNKLFRIFLVFFTVCASVISTLFAVSFALSNSGLKYKNEELTEEVDELTEVIGDLRDAMDGSSNSASIASYEVNGSLWRIQIVPNDVAFELPKPLDNELQFFDGWQIEGDSTILKGNYNINQNVKFIANMVDRDWVRTSFVGITNPSAQNVWTNGVDYYYSNGESQQYVLDKASKTWLPCSWEGYQNIYGNNIWSDGSDTYYSSGNIQYVLDSEGIWQPKEWVNLAYFSGTNVCKLENVYYVLENSKYYQLDGNTWSEKKFFTPSTNFSNNGGFWTDGVDCFYSYYGNDYILDRTNNKWESIKWNVSGLTGSNVWNEGENCYYSYGGTQYKLNKSTRMWENMTWDGFKPEFASNIWSDGINYYYSNEQQQYILDSANQKWNQTNVIGPNKSFVVSHTDIWTDGIDYYCSNRYVFDVATNSWLSVNITGISSFSSSYVWTDGVDTYYSSSTSGSYVFDRNNLKWEKKEWTGLTKISGTSVWCDGTNVYYSSGSSQYVLDNDKVNWSAVTWEGLESGYTIDGYNIWTDGINIYHTLSNKCYVLEKGTRTWQLKEWYGLGNISFSRIYVWFDGITCYYSDWNNLLYLNPANNTWYPVEFYKEDGTIFKIYGVNIFHVNNNVYMSDSGKNYLFDIATKTFKSFTWNGSFNPNKTYIWTDGEDYYYSYYSEQYKFNKMKNYWEVTTWNGEITTPNATYIWTTHGVNKKIYYSYDGQQYVLNTETKTWEKQTWNGLRSFSGQYVWSDHNKIYYTNGLQQYVLDENSNTWEVMIWNGPDSGKAISNIWTDGVNYYYSNGSQEQFKLNTQTFVWEKVNWNGVSTSNLYGKYIWNYKNETYFSYGSQQYVLDKTTGTWNKASWLGSPSFYGDTVWTDGVNYYCNGSDTMNGTSYTGAYMLVKK